MRLKPEQRRSVILRAGVDMANDKGLGNVTFEALADTCDPATSIATIRFYFRSRGDLWGAIARHDDARDAVVVAARRLGVL